MRGLLNFVSGHLASLDDFTLQFGIRSIGFVVVYVHFYVLFCLFSPWLKDQGAFPDFSDFPVSLFDLFLCLAFLVVQGGFLDTSLPSFVCRYRALPMGMVDTLIEIDFSLSHLSHARPEANPTGHRTGCI